MQRGVAVAVSRSASPTFMLKGRKKIVAVLYVKGAEFYQRGFLALRRFRRNFQRHALVFRLLLVSHVIIHEKIARRAVRSGAAILRDADGVAKVFCVGWVQRIVGRNHALHFAKVFPKVRGKERVKLYLIVGRADLSVLADGREKVVAFSHRSFREPVVLLSCSVESFPSGFVPPWYM